MKVNRQKTKIRNPFHDHPQMRKGGVHEKSSKAKRKAEKQKLKKQWCCLFIFELESINNTTVYG